MYSGQHQTPPNYVMLPPQYGAPPNPYYGSPQPYPYHRPVTQRSRRNCCLSCICCIYCLLFLLILFFATGLVLTYTFYRPKVPIYKLEDLNVTTFNMEPDASINVDLLVMVRAENPNKKIKFIYGKGSSIAVSFEDSILCSGKLPAFHQGQGNVTMIKVPLLGKTRIGPVLAKALVVDQRQGRIPLIIQVVVPVTVVMDTVPLRQFDLHVSCHMTVDSLRPDKKPVILSNSYSLGFGF